MRTEIHDRLDALVGLRTQWQALESRALEPNAYLSARFVLPSLALLPASPPVWAVSVHDGATAAGTLRGPGLFQARAPRPLFPFPHAQLCTSPHSFLGGCCRTRKPRTRHCMRCWTPWPDAPPVCGWTR